MEEWKRKLHDIEVVITLWKNLRELPKPPKVRHTTLHNIHQDADMLVRRLVSEVPDLAEAAYEGSTSNDNPGYLET